MMRQLLVIEKESIDMNIAFWGDRYSQERGKDEEIEAWKERIKNSSEKQLYKSSYE